MKPLRKLRWYEWVRVWIASRILGKALWAELIESEFWASKRWGYGGAKVIHGSD